MEFTTPTSKVEMYETLKNIYNFYRINFAGYVMHEREEFVLERLNIDVLDDSALQSLAETLVTPSITREKEKKKSELQDKIYALTEKKEKIQDDYDEIYKKIDAEYEKIIENIREEASKKGLSYNSLTTDKIYKAEKDKAEKISTAQAKESQLLSDIDGKITSFNTELDGLDDYFDNLLIQDRDVKYHELKDVQEKKVQDVFKYNNSLEEKELRYRNANVSSEASLELKYLEIQTKGFSKEKLVELGYYRDVIRCVTGYYDTLSALSAYNDMKNEYELVTYMEDFYQDILFAYQLRATE